MNFQELLKKMAALDQPVQEEKKADKDYDGDGEVESEKDEVWGSRMKAAAKSKEEKVDEEVVDECGMMGGMGPMEAPKQQDSVTMNVSMNGSGAGGIRDLLNVLKDIQDGPSDTHGDEPHMDIDAGPDSADDMLMKKKIDSMAGQIDDDFANSAPGDQGPETLGVDAVTNPPSNGIHSPAGKVAHTKDPVYQPKGHTMKMQDGATFKLPPGDVKIKLENLYNEIKNR